jgi:calcineurin-like phosphoesterase family protein
MDEALADSWSDTVGKDDLVYHLGDIAWKPSKLAIFKSLPGTKRLMLGNHDSGKKVAPLVQSLSLFEKKPEWGIVFSHMPIDLESERFQGFINVHGHIHEQPSPTDSHVNACVEWTDYKPKPIEDFLNHNPAQVPHK